MTGFTPTIDKVDPRSGERMRADGWHCRDEAVMATSVRVELWCEDNDRARAAIDAVMDDMRRIERSMNAFDPHSDLSVINRDAAQRSVEVNAELYGLIERSLDFSRLSGGAFDITFASAGHLYDYRRGIRPSDEALAHARKSVGYRNLILDPQARTVRFAQPGVRIDLGGFAKGHAVDRGAAILARLGIAHAIVTAGGDSRVVGDRRGRPWTIGIRDPRHAGEVVAVLPLEDVAISTSGDYERYFERDGVRCHHLIDPKTGKSPSSVRSVTILAADALTTEGLSKSVFVLGVEAGLRLVETQAGVDAIIIDAAGALHYSSGLLGATATPDQRQ